MPFVNAGLTEQNADTFRRLLWNDTMNGQYPTSAVDSKQMSIWFDFFADTRHWELEPYFDVDGGRAIALEGVEYVLYVEKPGPVEVSRRTAWLRRPLAEPINGETVKLKNYKGEKFAAEPPNNNHEWVLYLSREGKKESMLGSYKFESRLIELQEVEQTPRNSRSPLSSRSRTRSPSRSRPSSKSGCAGRPEPRGSMMYLWTGDVVEDGLGFRVLGTWREGVSG